MELVAGRNGGKLKRPAKGESGNPNGRPRKLMSKFNALGYKTSEVNDCLQNLLALTPDKLREVVTDKEVNALEQMMAQAILEDLKNKTFHTFQPILNRIVGMPKQSVEVSQVTPELSIALKHYRSMLEQGLSKEEALKEIIELMSQTGVKVTEDEILRAELVG